MDGPESVGSSAVKTAIDTNATMIGKHYFLHIYIAYRIQHTPVTPSAISACLLAFIQQSVLRCSHANPSSAFASAVTVLCVFRYTLTHFLLVAVYFTTFAAQQWC
jgi:hypothetical protein